MTAGLEVSRTFFFEREEVAGGGWGGWGGGRWSPEPLRKKIIKGIRFPHKRKQLQAATNTVF